MYGMRYYYVSGLILYVFVCLGKKGEEKRVVGIDRVLDVCGWGQRYREIKKKK